MSKETDKMLYRVHQMRERIQKGEIISHEIGLLKIGATAGFEVAALVPTDREIQIFSYFYPYGVETELKIYRYTSTTDFHFVLEDSLKPLRTMPEAIKVCGEIRNLIEEGLSYIEAVSSYKL